MNAKNIFPVYADLTLKLWFGFWTIPAQLLAPTLGHIGTQWQDEHI